MLEREGMEFGFVYSAIFIYRNQRIRIIQLVFQNACACTLSHTAVDDS